MKLLLIRHGEPSYDELTMKGYKGHGMDLAHLTERGIMKAKNVAKDKRLKDAEIIISSPYTRALQTAAIISKELNLDIIVENDIHEWIPDLTFNNNSDECVVDAVKEIIKYKGEHPEGVKLKWEPLSHVANRAISCLKKYLHVAIVVCHGVVIRQFKFKKEIDYCEITEVDFDKDFTWGGWVDD